MHLLWLKSSTARNRHSQLVPGLKHLAGCRQEQGEVRSSRQGSLRSRSRTGSEMLQGSGIALQHPLLVAAQVSWLCEIR